MSTRFFTALSVMPVKPCMSSDTIAVLYEQQWLKFKDKQPWSHQESPTFALMQLALTNGIRPQTTCNGQGYLFFIRESDIPAFLACLGAAGHIEFRREVTHKIAADKAQEALQAARKSVLPSWF